MNSKGNFSLSRKAILLVTVPVIFQIVLFACLTALLFRIDAERAGEAHGRMLVTHLSQMLASHFQRISLLFMSRMTGDEKYGQRADRIKSGVHEQIAIIDTIVGNNTEESAAWNTIKEDEKGLDTKMRLAVTLYNSGDKMQAAQVWSQSQRTMGEMFLLVEKLIREEEERVEMQSRSLENYNRQVALLLAGLFAGIAIPFTLLLIFNRSLSQRLAVLLNNARQLAAGNSPTQILSGGDELAELDVVYHDLHRSLSIMRRKERAVIENAAEIICSLDENLRIVDMNNAVSSSWGLASEELIGRRLPEIISADDRANALDKLQESVRENKIARFTAVIACAGSRQRTTSWSVTWSEDEQSHYCVVQDITERAHVEKMKNEFVAMVGHDLRTPLAAVIMAHSLLQTEPISEQAQRVLSLASENVERLLAMVNNLLDVDKMQSGALDIFASLQHVDSSVSAAINSMNLLAEKKKIKLTSQVAPDLEAYFDEERLMQVLINLLANALKFSEPDKEIAITAAKSADMVKIEVVDQGCGIPEDKCRMIFDRFTQVSDDDRLKESGVGLGLSICKAIIAAHGGQIGVDSTLGVGSRFWFTVPAHEVVIEKLSK